MRRLYATRWDTRNKASYVQFRRDIADYVDQRDVRVIRDVANDHHIIILTTCTALQYACMKFFYQDDPLIEIEWDYFNFNEIEEY